MRIGVDEVGRGALAGPVVAAALILPWPDPEGLAARMADSKTLTAARREALAAALAAAGARAALGAASVAEIERLNIRGATLLAMRRALARLLAGTSAEGMRILIDGRDVPPGLPWPAEALIDGDALEPAIAGASIWAKCARDRLMLRLHQRFPNYGWDSNAGYGTPAHLDGLSRHGVCPHHRRHFRPVISFLPQPPDLTQ